MDGAIATRQRVGFRVQFTTNKKGMQPCPLVVYQDVVLLAQYCMESKVGGGPSYPVGS
jgi:hypothetical protein